MPPKKTRSSSTKTKEAKHSFNSVSIQTEDYSNNEEILDYQNQIKHLHDTIEDYKRQIDMLNSEINILRNQNSNDTMKNEVLGKNLLKVRNDKISSPGSGRKINKGCSCKGNCSNKICGCVKKGIQCQEFCKCNDAQCKNQEPDKENFEQAVLTEDGQKVLEKFTHLTLHQESLHASEKKAKRGMFSPFGNGEKNIPGSPFNNGTRRRLFTETNDFIDIDTDTNQDKSVAKSTHVDSKQHLNSIQKLQSECSSTPIAKRVRRFKNIEENSETATTETKDVEEKQDVKKLDKETEKTNNEDNEQLQCPGILISNNTPENNEEEIFSSKGHKKVVHSPRVPRRISKSVSPDRYSNNKIVRRIKSRSVSPNENITDKQDEEDQPKIGRVQHSPQPINNQIFSIKQENIDNNKINEETLSNQSEENIKESLESNLNKYSGSFQSNASESNSSSNNDFLDVSLNPMIPKHQLPRSPINAPGNTSVLTEKKRFSPPKKELAVVEIDWEQHQSELVMCKKCKRKFFPHRVEKHMISCKKI